MGRLSIKEVMEGVREEQDKRQAEKEIRDKEENKEKEKKLSYEEEGFEFEDLNAEKAEETEEEREEEERIRSEQLKKAMRVLELVIGAMLIVGGLVFVVIFNTPNRRYERNYARAEECYGEEQYNEALKYYGKALKAHKESLDCYLGILCSKEATDAEDLIEEFKGGVAFMEALPEETRKENESLIVEYILHESTVYSDDEKLREQSLRHGIDMLGGNTDLERVLKEEVYAYVDEMVEKGKFNYAIERLKYFVDIPSMEAEDKIAEVEREEAIYKAKVDVLGKVAETLSDYYSKFVGDAGHDPFSYSFDELMKLDGSREAEKLVMSESAESYSMSVPDSEEEEVSLVTFGRKYRNEAGEYTWPYYFTVGNTLNGKAVSFMRTGETSYVLFEGDWENGKPEGNGTKYIADTDNGILATYTGVWHEGLAEGEIAVSLVSADWEGVTFTGTLKALKGVGETVPTENEDYVIQNIRSENLIAVLQSDTDGYGLCYAIWQKNIGKIDAVGMY